MQMNALSCHLAGYADLQISWNDALQPAMAGLQALIGGRVQPEEGEADFVLHDTADFNSSTLVYDGAHKRFSCRLAPSSGLQKQVLLWRTAIICAAASRLMRGEPLCLMHGCLLQLQEGRGVFLCGQSGMGKSTTADRWKAAGGICPADDMVLMEKNGDALYAHPLPTWSRCIESLEGEQVSFEEPLELCSILALSRDEQAEEIRAFEPFKYLSVLYSSCCLFNMELAKLLPADSQREFIRTLQDCAKHLSGIFPPRALFANLQGNLMQTLDQKKI